MASIGSSDPWNAAGIGLDIRALAACGVRAVTIVAGVTAQDERGVFAAAAVAPALIAAQFEALAHAGIAAYRIGALLDPASVHAVAAALAAVRSPVVYDPVLAPSAGGTFAGDATLDAIRTALLPRASVVTPNLAEAARLTGEPVGDVAAMERAGRALLTLGAQAALVKGGHLTGIAVDVLVDGEGVVAFEAPRLRGELRGSGCLLACGIAAGLARGAPLRAAVETARAFVRDRFEGAATLGTMRVAY